MEINWTEINFTFPQRACELKLTSLTALYFCNVYLLLNALAAFVLEKALWIVA